MRHYSTKLGFVFHKSTTVVYGKNCKSYMTPYQFACSKYGKEEATKEIRDSISEYFPATGSAESILLPMAADEAIALDGLILFLRREPSALLRYFK